MTEPHNRRTFLSWLGASGAFAAGALPMTRSHAGAQLVPVDPKWDLSWCDRITGKVRAVFDSPGASEGAALFRAQMWREQHASVYGAPLQDSTAVGVFRHEGIALVMNHAYWDRFNIGRDLKLKDEKGKKWATRNPVDVPAPGGPADMAAYNIPAFIAAAGIVLACNLAFGEIVGKFREQDKLDKDAARQRAIEHLIPGVMLQPSGVFAALRAQQAGCNYLLGS